MTTARTTAHHSDAASRRTHLKRISGFTLIELLVVIAIIAILAAILFPVFAKVREKARQISCASNEKQLALGLLQYVQDSDETYPGGDSYGIYSQEGRGWASRIYPYVKSTAVYKCNDDPTAQSGHLVPVSYGINANLGGIFVPPRALASLTAPSVTVELFEVQGAVDYVSDPNGDVQNAASYPGQVNTSVAGDGGDLGAGFIDSVLNAKYATGVMGQPYRYTDASRWTTPPQGIHTGGSNFAMADGHVKWLRPPSVSPGFANSVPSDDQDQGTSVFGSSSGLAAGTGFMGQSPKNFVATFSPI
jgi:prepilin-type N-terminal cleavage/methylation domain-containing protein/prepilin-type processing-associated H-X9-DG protein